MKIRIIFGYSKEYALSLVGAAVSLDGEGNPRYVKMGVLENISGESLTDFACLRIREWAVIRSYAYSAYRKAFATGKYRHEPEKFDVREKHEHLKWLHRIAGNAKAFILGTYYRLGKKRLPAYLNEFCFRINRRRFVNQLFNPLLNACMLSPSITYRDLVSPVPS